MKTLSGFFCVIPAIIFFFFIDIILVEKIDIYLFKLFVRIYLLLYDCNLMLSDGEYNLLTYLGNLTERFDCSPRLVKKFVHQGEKDFTLEVSTNIQNSRVYFKEKKYQVPDKNFFHHTNKQSIKVTVSACLTWNGAIQPFFVNGCGVKMNAKTYKRHLQKELLPAVQRFYKHKNCTFVQDNAPSHCSNVVIYKKHSI